MKDEFYFSNDDNVLIEVGLIADELIAIKWEFENQAMFLGIPDKSVKKLIDDLTRALKVREQQIKSNIVKFKS